MPVKERLDNLMVLKGLSETAARAQALIMSGAVMVNGEKIDKPGTLVSSESAIELATRREFVGRGAYKLLGALTDFKINVADKICADVGSSTGGFTEVLLKNGAKKVYAIDVGYGELDWRLRKDSRVVVMERTNARTIEKLPEPIELVTIDVSFISLKVLMPVVHGWLAEAADVLAMVKPQFEASREEVGEGGIVNDKEVHKRVVLEVINESVKHGFSFQAAAPSKLEGTQGNQEYFSWLSVPKNISKNIESINQIFK